MPWTETPPFDRGTSFMAGTAIDTVNDPTPAVNLEGKEYIFPDKVYGTGVPVKVRCVRNTTGGLLYPSLLYAFDPAYLRQRVNSLALTANQLNIAPADELLPAAGVQNNDLVYVVISGPCLVTLPSAAGAGLVINQGDQLIGAAATATTDPSAGSAQVGNTVGSTARANGMVARAMSAATTGNTAVKILAMIESLW